MIYCDPRLLLSVAVRRMKSAATVQVWNGRDAVPPSCIWYLAKYPVTCVYTREDGYHSGGWWKNPDYERCWHLSISFLGGVDRYVKREILKALFAPHEKLLWVEGPFSSFGKSRDVWHYRLFCDENWMPLHPRGEVYSTQFTERGWKSFTEVISKK